MTGVPDERDEDRFEEVLNRLDALVRRGQPAEGPPPPPPSGEQGIPVLTEIYRPDPECPSDSASVTDALPVPEPALDAVSPLLTQVLDDILVEQLRPALEAALNSKVEELRPQLEVWLREALERALKSGAS